MDFGTRGCAKCRESSETIVPVRVLWDSSHSSFDLCRCEACGQRYLKQFEELQYGDEDEIWTFWMALTPLEAADLAAVCPANPAERPAGLREGLAELMLRRDRLVMDPRGRLCEPAGAANEREAER